MKFHRIFISIVAFSAFLFPTGASAVNLHQSDFDPKGGQSESTILGILQASAPNWKILVLIYSQTDFSYSDSGGQHRVVATMTADEKQEAETAASRFVNDDVPLLTSGFMTPTITIRYPSNALTSLSGACGYWPSMSDTAADRDASFDSVIVIWDDTGSDIIQGGQVDLNYCGGLAMSNGTGQTYTAIPVESVNLWQQNVFKHEWGHSILYYFNALGATPSPTVDNHINSTTIQYVHCGSGEPYVLQDETNANPIPNSIYNNYSGFTHDYYSGTTAKPENPSSCLGISEAA